MVTEPKGFFSNLHKTYLQDYLFNFTWTYICIYVSFIHQDWSRFPPGEKPYRIFEDIPTEDILRIQSYTVVDPWKMFARVSAYALLKHNFNLFYLEFTELNTAGIWKAHTFPWVFWFVGFLAVFVMDVPARFSSDDMTVGLLLLGGELFFWRKRKFKLLTNEISICYQEQLSIVRRK